MPTRSGSCLCGAVRYTVVGEPLVARICWCHVCQKIAGNGTANAIFPSEAIKVTGPTSVFTSAADSGSAISRHFCAACGSHLFASSSANAAFRVVRIGTLDDPSSITPTINMWASRAPGWACLDSGLIAAAEQPAPVSPPPETNP